MPTLLEKLEKLGAQKNENRRENPTPDSQSENSPARKNCTPGPATPCRDCGCQLAWLDRYGGGPHCFRCRPYPTDILVADIVVAIAGAGRWITLSEAQKLHTGQDQDQDAGQMPECGHPRLRKRVVFRPGEALIAAETFWECASCGTWISAEEFANCRG